MQELANLLESIDSDEANNHVKSIYDEIDQTFGSVGDPWMTIARSPDFLGILWKFTRDTLRKFRDRDLFFMVGFEVANADGCNKCKMGFKDMLRRIGLDEELITKLEREIASAGVNEKTKSVLIFAYQAAKDPHRISNEMLVALKLAGLADEELIKVASAVSAWKAIIELNHSLNIH